MAQLVPSQPSANISVLPETLATAMHELPDVHATPLNWVLVVPLGWGVLWILQLVPFHFSASGSCAPDFL